jgi:hypothetical protein
VYGLPVTRLHPLRLLLLVLIAILCPAKASAATAAWIETRVGLASDLLEAIQGGGVPWLTQASTFLSAASAAHAADYGGLYTNTRTTVAIAAVVANPAAILGELKGVQEVIEAIEVETGVARVAAAAEGAEATSTAIAKYWPPNNGVLGEAVQTTLQPGTVIDRFGALGGRFASPAGTPFAMRALPPGAASAPYNMFRVLQPFEVNAGTTAPAFGQIGMGLQYELPNSVGALIEGGFPEPLP